MLPIHVDGTPGFDAALTALRIRGVSDLESVEPAPATEGLQAHARAATLRVAARVEKVSRPAPEPGAEAVLAPPEAADR